VAEDNELPTDDTVLDTDESVFETTPPAPEGAEGVPDDGVAGVVVAGGAAPAAPAGVPAALPAAWPAVVGGVGAPLTALPRSFVACVTRDSVCVTAEPA
jgi:hypothetical protein